MTARNYMMYGDIFAIKLGGVGIELNYSRMHSHIIYIGEILRH